MIYTYDEDGDYIIPGRWGDGQQEQTCDASVLTLANIPTGATITAGYSVSGEFKAYSEGEI